MKTLLTLFTLAVMLNAKAQVEVSGTVKNYTDSIFYISETGGFNNFTRVWRDNRAKVIINKDKTFNVTIPEKSIGSWYIKTGNEKQIQMFDFVKGEKLQLIVDFSQLNPIHAIGKNAGDFNFSAVLYDSLQNYYSQYNYIERNRSKNIDSALYYRKKLASYEINLLNKFRSKHEMSARYYNWLKSKYSYQPFERTLVENIKNRDSLDNTTISKLWKKELMMSMRH